MLNSQIGIMTEQNERVGGEANDRDRQNANKIHDLTHDLKNQEKACADFEHDLRQMGHDNREEQTTNYD